VRCQGAHNWQPTAWKFRKVEQVLDSSRKHLPLLWAMHRLLTTVAMTETLSGSSVTGTGLS